MVLMLTSGLFKICSTLCKVVDLPEPVGPVTRIMPWGWRLAALMSSSALPQNPSDSKDNGSLDSSKTRITTFSPSVIGNVDTRKANTRPFIFILKRPS